MNSYFKHIQEGIQTTLTGMRLTWRHLWAARQRRSEHSIRENDYFASSDGMVTLQYPFETMPIPDNGRYRLHNEMDDCIVCDKCAKICPVDCIEIEPIKATGEVGKASDGSPIRLYAAKFDIDMAKCCYCGLCTTVCPTECLTMTKTFDFSEFEMRDMNYQFGNLTPAQAEEKRALYEQFMAEKEAFKKQIAVGSEQLAESSGNVPVPSRPKPAFVPKKQVAVSEQPLADEVSAPPAPPRPKPAFVPKKQSVVGEQPSAEAHVKEPQAEVQPDKNENTDSGAEKPRPKPVFKPTMRPKS
ncbi:MAG: 4Fe-4S dicluster domain-containing protein [Spirosomaceae bacterium]|nr:4Fe-4S dicluster domain-containing protein [Spirosomataceae bacterium]